MTTTTSNFQKNPDFYSSVEECSASYRNKQQTNIRYRNFTQTHFTAGDEDQFQNYRCAINGNICNTSISLDKNIFYNNPEVKEEPIFEGYTNLEATNVLETFRYLFNKFKKGIFIKILNNELKVFLPFSNVNFRNEWSNFIKIDKKYGTLYNFIKYTNDIEGRSFYKNGVNEFINTWYGNNSLVRYEYPIKESDTNISCIKDMFEELCKNRKVPDIEFFVNRRDFPLLTKNGTEPYYHLWNTMNQPLVSHKYDKYVPILSMSKSDYFADILIPTHEDWSRVQVAESKFFVKSRVNIDILNNDWNSKKSTAVFRGSSTGYGVTIETNQRLKISYLSANLKTIDGDVPYLDAGITKWNTRPRKFIDCEFLQTIEVDKLPFKLVKHMSFSEQSNYKYVVHIDGHVSAFRLSYELSMNSVILLVKSPWKIWYSNMLQENIHYISVKEDMSDLIDKIKWCRDNDDQCKIIAKNARNFYLKYLSKDGIFDYMQKLLINIKKITGTYMYNIKSLLDIQTEYQSKQIKKLKIYPKTTKILNDKSLIPKISRSYEYLKGIHFVMNTLSNIKNYITYLDEIFINKLGILNKYEFLGFPLCIKTTNDINKIKEHIHETYIGLTCINKLLNRIPNFTYNFGMYKTSGNTYNIMSEYITGQTLKEYISSNNFNFYEYIFIILQICLALHIAQKEFCFVHNDLTPWNIIIQRFKEPVYVEYIISSKKVIRLKTNTIPIIVDYGKSHVIYENKHYGIINMFNFSSSIDIISILVTSIYQICIDHHLGKNEFNSLLKLANFLTNTSYCKEPFTSSKDLKLFLHTAKKYSNLITINKHELTLKTPLDLFYYIRKNIRYKFDIENVDVYNNLMDKGDSEQVFDYILSTDNIERSKTYENAFERLKNNIMNYSYDNMIYTYYISQNSDIKMNNLLSDMNEFNNNNNLICSEYIYNIINTIRNFLISEVNKIKLIKLVHIENHTFAVKIINYNEDIFMLPEKLYHTIQEFTLVDISDYKNMIDLICLNKGVYQVKDSHRVLIYTKFEKFFETTNIVLKIHDANNYTLKYLANILYKANVEELNKIENKDENVIYKIKAYSNVLEKI